MKEENIWYCCTDQSVHVVEVKWCLGEDCRVVAAWCLYTGGDSQPSARDQQPLPPPVLAPSVRPAAPPVDNDLINWVNHEYYRPAHSLTDQKEIKKILGEHFIRVIAYTFRIISQRKILLYSQTSGRLVCYLLCLLRTY